MTRALAIVTSAMLALAGCGDEPSTTDPAALGCREALERLIAANRRVNRIVHRDPREGLGGTLQERAERLRGIAKAVAAMEVPARLRRLRDLNARHADAWAEDEMDEAVGLSAEIGELQVELLGDPGCR
ncbi:MAG TPA: hypothetical protein VMP42_02870 [Actinomycetota bacterium]|nr:hypothetical protein [Actinomycetota bacterium]